MSDFAIKAENIGKLYYRRRKRAGTLRDTLAGAWASVGRQQSEAFWALKEVSFEVPQGEVLGIIGRNGAGKSTLLKILSRITPPTTGRVALNGRIASLLEVGTGFHPELTGRENIFMNGAILGMSRAEIRRKFDEIVDFSGVEAFIDTPVKHYSSGMYVRLAFSVAAYTETEITLIDEVLAVGDQRFKQKSIKKIESLHEMGKTVLFVSHDLEIIQKICSVAMVIVNGELIQPPEHPIKAINRYLQLGITNSKSIDYYRQNGLSKNILFQEIKIENDRLLFMEGEDLVFSIGLISNKVMEKISIGCTIFSASGKPIGVSLSNPFPVLSTGQIALLFRLVAPNLSPGKYHFGFSVGKGTFSNRYDFDLIVGYPEIEITPRNQEDVFYWNPSWGSCRFLSVVEIN